MKRHWEVFIDRWERFIDRVTRRHVLVFLYMTFLLILLTVFGY